MPVTREEALNIARLIGIDFNETEMAIITQQLNQVLEYIQKLNEIDTTDIDPLFNPLELVNIYREDLNASSLNTEQVFLNAPERKNNYFIVPKVINHD